MTPAQIAYIAAAVVSSVLVAAACMRLPTDGMILFPEDMPDKGRFMAEVGRAQSRVRLLRWRAPALFSVQLALVLPAAFLLDRFGWVTLIGDACCLAVFALVAAARTSIRNAGDAIERHLARTSIRQETELLAHQARSYVPPSAWTPGPLN